MNLDRKIHLYNERGWCPVPWGHLPPEIKAEIKRLHFRPKLKSCFENCQRFIIGTNLDVQYHEGYVVVLIPTEHAWLTWRGEVVDLTLNKEAQYLKSNIYTRGQIVGSMVRNGVWGPVDQRALWGCGPWAEYRRCK